MAKIYYRNENCLDTMSGMIKTGYKVNIILTSPPYNTARLCKTQRSIENHENRYDIHLDNMTDDEYSQWTADLFRQFDKVLSKDGVVLYNISYGSENPNSMWQAVSSLVTSTDFMIADTIVWKKRTALPNNVSHNKLTRITEFVFVICRKSEFKTFMANKKVTSTSSTGQKYYENVYNFIEAPNNDGSNKLNKAAYSSELCEKLLDIYATKDCIVYDPFMGTGTTGIACERYGNDKMICIGSELSSAQVEYSKQRLEDLRKETINIQKNQVE